MRVDRKEEEVRQDERKSCYRCVLSRKQRRPLGNPRWGSENSTPFETTRTKCKTWSSFFPVPSKSSERMSDSCVCNVCVWLSDFDSKLYVFPPEIEGETRQAIGSISWVHFNVWWPLSIKMEGRFSLTCLLWCVVLCRLLHCFIFSRNTVHSFVLSVFVSQSDFIGMQQNYTSFCT